MSEFALIELIRQRCGPRHDVLLGIGDDGALLAVPPGSLLAVSTDTLNEGVHFLARHAARDIGHKSAAVNLSDLAAMGAEPAWMTLSLSLPEADEGWLRGFLDGFLGLCELHGATLVGGDTTRGALSICVTAMGHVPHGRALRRDAAKLGDDIWVTGSLGDAAAALRLGDEADDYLRGRLLRPAPRVEAGLALRRLARAAIDISDGLLGDLGHVLSASKTGAVLQLDALPSSQALQAAFDDPEQRWNCQLCGGDDYELAFTADPSRRHDIEQEIEALGVRVSRIGSVRAESGVVLQRADGTCWRPGGGAFQHFGAAS